MSQPFAGQAVRPPISEGLRYGMSTTQAKPRIGLYGIGQYGQQAVCIAADYGWPIVAAWNRTGDKVGQDLGRVADLGRDLGVLIEDCENADFASVNADVAIVAVTDRLASNLPIYAKLLGAGINVICHGAEAYFPFGADTGLAAQIDELAKANGVSFTGTGIWDHSRIWSGILAAGPATRIESFFHKSITDAEAANIALMRVCGVGMTQDEFAQHMGGQLGPIGGLYKLIPHHVLHALGYDVTEVKERREPVLSATPTYCRLLDETLEPGRVIGTRIVATVKTREGVTAGTHIELRILPEGECEHMVWEIGGIPATKVRVDRTHAVHTSAACLINRVPDVMAAAPGICLISELGVLTSKRPRR